MLGARSSSIPWTTEVAAMINEVDEALRNLVKSEVVNGADVEVLFEAPTREWASRRNTPTVDLYLYDIREDLRHRQTGTIEVRNDQGMVVERRPVPRFFKLAYLITAWTQRPEDEHRLLSAILACFLRHDNVPDAALTPMLRELEVPLQVMIAYPPPENRQVSDVWSSLGGDLKPSVDLVITIALQPDTLYEVAQAVMAPLRLRAVGHTTYDVEDDVRQLRQPLAGEPGPAQTGAAEPVPVAAVGAKPSKSPRAKGP
jgi:plasmid stability protein